MRLIALAVCVLLAACSVGLPAPEPSFAPPPPAHPELAPEPQAPQPQAPAQPPPKVAAAHAPAPAPKPAPTPAAKAAPAPKAPAASPPKTAAVAPKPAAAPAQPARRPLDLRSLEERLKDTDAIGVLTKLSLKNQVDDLVARFREFHAGRQPPTLAELRRPFELLLMKVLSLLQDKDTALAHDIDASREAIWSVLSDRDKLAQFT